jgi:hypothetical protein
MSANRLRFFSGVAASAGATGLLDGGGSLDYDAAPRNWILLEVRRNSTSVRLLF